MSHKDFTRYYNAITYLEGLSNLTLTADYMTKRNAGIYIQRMRYFLGLLGNPDKGMKIIHITGTAGKGSVTNMVHEILTVAGKQVGMFTSPFVTTSIEKIKVNNLYIDPNEFADIVEYLKPFIDTAYGTGPYGQPSYFEIFFAIALVYFKKMKCEYAVLEVGLGGRYDATNVIEKPVITAITNIDYDHMHVLGKTLKKIAYDKAGIIKPGSVFFTSEQRPALKKIFKDICNEYSVPMYFLPRQTHHQDSNRNLARMITRNLEINEKHIDQAIQQARLQCRFEIMQSYPTIILDGAHNRAKVRSTIENLKNLSYHKLHLIIGIAANKDTSSMLEDIIPLADTICFTRFQLKDRPAAHPNNLLKQSKEYLRKVTLTSIFLDPEHALSHAMKHARKDDAILVVGSFFLAGELRKRWFPEEWVLSNRTSF